MSTASPSVAHLDPLLQCLSRSQRRFVIEYLHEHGGVAGVADLAAALARHERVEDEHARDGITAALENVHLPELVASGLVTVDGDDVALQTAATFELLADLRSCIERHVDVRDGAAGDRQVDTYATYCPAEDSSLTDAIVDAIVEHRGDELSRTDFSIFEDLDAQALNALFRTDGEPRTRVAFETDEIAVELWGSGRVHVRVSDAEGSS